MTRVALLGIAFGMLVACGARTGPPRPVPREYPGFMAPTQALSPPFVMQQRLQGRYGERKVSLDVVVQLSHAKLTLIGLTPFGSRAFVLEQEGDKVRFEKLINRELPFDPTYMLKDVHRVFFRGLSGPQPDGEHSRDEHGERLTERWQGGQLVERRFTRLDQNPAGAIVVRFKGAPAPVVAPHVELENGWFGYTLAIDSVAQQVLAD